jgi:hypothetical protein
LYLIKINSLLTAISSDSVRIFTLKPCANAVQVVHNKFEKWIWICN